MFNRPLASFVPNFYNGVVEIEDLIKSEEQILNIARTEMTTVFANTFVLTANEAGVIMFEKMLNIVADPSVEDLDFRKQRIINRMSMSPPFTFRFLKKKLDETIGPGAWKAYIDFGQYALYIESLATNQNWFHEIEFTVSRIKPCNIVFTNVPYTVYGMQLREEISYATSLWRYRLGSWKLGKYPFSTFEEGGIVKMASVRSIQPALFNDTANFIIEDVASVLINGVIKVSEFELKQVDDSVASIQYRVRPDMTNLITDIKLLRDDETVLTEASVYVPVTETVLCKHTITVKEGI